MPIYTHECTTHMLLCTGEQSTFTDCTSQFGLVEKKHYEAADLFLLSFKLFEHWSGNNQIMIYYIHRPEKREKLKAVYANFKLSFGFSFFNSHCGQYEQQTKENR